MDLFKERSSVLDRAKVLKEQAPFLHFCIKQKETQKYTDIYFFIKTNLKSSILKESEFSSL